MGMLKWGHKFQHYNLTLDSIAEVLMLGRGLQQEASFTKLPPEKNDSSPVSGSLLSKASNISQALELQTPEFKFLFYHLTIMRH